MMKRLLCVLAVLMCGQLFLVACDRQAQDEAMRAGREADSFKAADENYFHDMDRGVDLTDSEVIGRNNWIVWTGGNDRFWDWLSSFSFGTFDLLKVVSNHPSLKYSRDNRWYWFGLVNEPGFEKWQPPAGCNPMTEVCGDLNRFGLWLDKRTGPPDPFENAAKYPGVEIGARGKNMPIGSFYGEASGIIGLRLFPNPEFDEKAQRAWYPLKYYTDPTYYESKKLIRPYRVGMSCAFCHVGPSPINPPDDFENPKWANLNSNPGTQYYWFDRVFYWSADETSFPYQWYKTYLPGTIDTSLISSDNINNPRTMNAVYNVLERLDAAKRWHEEVLTGGSLNNKQFTDYPVTQSLGMFTPPDKSQTPMVLKDGADSVGVLGALNRVYVNIGLFSEEWTKHFIPVVGGKEITPFEIEVAEENSSYWNATTDQTPHLAAFFLKASPPDYLQDAPGGADYLTDDVEILNQGKQVFAKNCARCHSSKQPLLLCDSAASCPDGGVVRKTAEHIEWLRAEVARDDFLDGNYLSTEERIPVTELGTNICSPLATNAIEGDICLVTDLQGLAVGRQGHGPSPSNRRALAIRDAGRRAWLHSRAVAHQLVVDGTISAQQLSRQLRVGRHGSCSHALVQRLDRKDAVAGEAEAGRAPRRQGARLHPAHHCR